MLALDSIEVCYGTRRVLSGVSFELRPGELVGVLGPNGAGKSTLLRTAAGLLSPSAGRITLGRRHIGEFGRRELARRIALVPQSTDMAFDFSVLQVVLMGRAPHLGALAIESDKDLAIAEEALREIDAWDLRDRSFSALSGGERQRIVLARALCQRPELLLLDEPAAFLDIRHQVSLSALLLAKTRAGRIAVVAAMHDLNLAAQTCDRVLLLREGSVVGLGTVDEVLTYGRVRETFGVDVYVGVNELTGARYFLPMVSRPMNRPGPGQ